MKNKSVELDVDFIGSQKETLTKEEEKMISDFIRLSKEKTKLKVRKSIKTKTKQPG
jgi:hypothetical protein